MTRILINYIREHVNRIVLDGMFVVIFIVVMDLRDFPIANAVYPAIICLFVWLIYVGLDIIKYVAKQRKLEKAACSIDATLRDLPEVTSLQEETYQELIRVVKDSGDQEILRINKANKEQEEYLTMWGHQIKTPITALELMVQDMSANGEEVTLEYIDVLKGNLFQLEQYVDMTLQYIRYGTMNNDLTIKKYSLERMVREAVKYFSRSFISKKIALRMEIGEDNVITDEKWMIFVLKQILSNSLKYTTEGEIHIYTRKTDNTLEVCIEDTGIGVEAEDIPRLFERGFTGYNGRKQKQATGLGLYLSKQVLDKLGNEIEIESESGRGCLVRVIYHTK